MRYTHILAPTDFSAPANHALGFAFDEAELHHAKVTLVYVLHHEAGTEVYHVQGSTEERQAFVDEFGDTIPTQQQATPHTLRRDHIEEALTRLCDLVPQSFTGAWKTEVAAGDPADEIVRLAREREVDLIVIGTHGRTGLHHVLLGSVAEHVVRHAPCPVLTIRQAVHKE